MPDWRGLRDLAGALRRRELSSVELTRQSLEGLDREGRELHAVEATLDERALRDARAADRQLRARVTPSPLAGIPYGAKDNIAAQGVPLTVGSDIFATRIARSDATVIARLRQAGAILVAKLAMIELAGAGGYRLPEASRQGATRNPWDTRRWSGGSSSGSASTVGAGLVPFALGSETGGSMALPSAYCGVTSIRPTFGLVGRGGVFPLSWTLDKVGPMARSAEDCVFALQVMAGYDVRDSASAKRPFRALRGRAAAKAVRDMRIGIVEVPDREIADPGAREALRRGEEDFVRLIGRKHKRIVLPAYPYDAMLTVIYFAEGASIFAHLIRGKQLEVVRDPSQRAGLKASLEVSAADYLSAMRLRVPLRAEIDQLFREADAILCIAQTRTATLVDEPRDRHALKRRSATVHAGSVDLIAAGNLAGLPAVYFPCGLTAEGLPVGLQLVGPRFSDALLLAAVESYQRSTSSTRRTPS